MTFLLQKFNAINRTRTEVRGRNGLRSSASGIAFTGRLAACLLLAGFLGVGSAMAQPKVLRVGGGEITVNLADEFPGATSGTWGVHHYVIGTMDAVDLTTDNGDADDPNDSDEDASFLVGPLALVSISNSMLTINPIAAGDFKIAVDPNYNTATDEDDATTALMPLFVEVMSGNSPQIVGKDNAASQMAATAVALQLRDKTSVVPDAHIKDLNAFFTDPNDVFLTYRAEADKVLGGVPVAADTKDAEDILSVSTAGAKLTIALTTKAKDGDMTDVWVFATDGAGEYARWQVPVSVGVGSSPYVVSAMAPGAMVCGKTILTNTDIDFSTTFMAGVAPNPNPTGVGGGDLDNYKIEISDATAAKVGTAPDVTYIVPSMVATVSG